ncbi:MAG: TSUP family transporter [Crocinitomicaceae bacterium]|jgi:uncharacterized membrane protein YfcA|tara:strand:+ start:9115 stop:9897 length:783 start_codon:yes stop_codon:yes gene_type:complete
MEELFIWILICVVSFSASILTFFSGFGLGTMLLPAFSLFMPIEMAVLATAIVHILNNALKFILIRKFIDKAVLIAFGVTAVVGAFIGAITQKNIGGDGSFYEIQVFDSIYTVELLSFVVGLLMIVFAVLDLIPLLKKISFGKGQFAIGGFLSGFFGGLSGHQGALRAAFLAKSNLKAEVFISTSVCLSLLIDAVRIPIYFTSENGDLSSNWLTISLACLFAFLGSYFGKKIFTKRKIQNVRVLVAVFLFVMGTGMLLGIV